MTVFCRSLPFLCTSDLYGFQSGKDGRVVRVQEEDLDFSFRRSDVDGGAPLFDKPETGHTAIAVVGSDDDDPAARRLQFLGEGKGAAADGNFPAVGIGLVRGGG